MSESATHDAIEAVARDSYGRLVAYIASRKTACDTLWFNENSGSKADCGIAGWFTTQT